VIVRIGGREAACAPELVILHRGPRYCVRLLRCGDAAAAVVCFEYWLAAPTLDGETSCENFFRHRGVNVIGILAAENDWFQHPEIDQALAAIRAATQGWDLAGYNGSMGGYAAINFADRLALSRLVAISPQYSIDAARAPYEHRWRSEAARIVATGGFGRDRIDQVPRLTSGWLIYDPWCVDGQHAASIQAHHGLAELRLYFSAHHLMAMLQQANLYSPMLLDMLAGRFDAAGFIRDWRRARHFSSIFLLGVAGALVRRGWMTRALRIVVAARALPHPDPSAMDMAEAPIRIALGHLAEAQAIAAPWAGDPACGAAARWCLEAIAWRISAAAASNAS